MFWTSLLARVGVDMVRIQLKLFPANILNILKGLCVSVIFSGNQSATFPVTVFSFQSFINMQNYILIL